MLRECPRITAKALMVWPEVWEQHTGSTMNTQSHWNLFGNPNQGSDVQNVSVARAGRTRFRAGRRLLRPWASLVSVLAAGWACRASDCTLFQTAPSYTSTNGLNLVAAADLNRDGNPDLVAAGWDGLPLTTMLGNGDGSFQEPRGFPGIYRPTAIAVGDVNNDSWPDVVAVDQQSDIVTFLGQGDGTLQSGLTTGRPGQSATSVALADFDKDGKLDAVVTDPGHYPHVQIFQGQGDGTFTYLSTCDAGSSPTIAMAGDLNADGMLDLVVGNLDSADVSIVLGLGDATFASPVQYGVGTGSRGRGHQRL